MALRNRMKEQQVRMVLVAMLILTGIYSCTVEAQSIRPIKYMGFQASFGVRSFVINSNIEEINQMQAGHEGGTLGVVFGNEALMARVGLAGIFYSNANTPRTQHLFETSISTNLYPLALGRNARQTGLHPYMTAGFSMDNVKFFGTYLDTKNTKTAYEPYLGKVSQINVQGGIGLEYRIDCRVDFINLFAEAMYGAPIQSSSTDTFSATSIKQFTTINVGVSFGRKR